MTSNIEIKDSFKKYSHDQDKTRRPEQTISWVRERLAGLDMNILARTVRIDTGRLDIPVYISLCGEDATRFTGTKKQMGKGATPQQSEASALMELMERFSFFSFIHDFPFPTFRYRDLDGFAVSAEDLKKSVYDTQTPTELCRRFLDDLPLRWVKAWNLTLGKEQWVPIDWFYTINEYNGPAAGNTMEEAILQALCEVVERHVGSIISNDMLVTPEIDIDSLRDPAAIELVEKFRCKRNQAFPARLFARYRDTDRRGACLRPVDLPGKKRDRLYGRDYLQSGKISLPGAYRNSPACGRFPEPHHLPAHPAKVCEPGRSRLHDEEQREGIHPGPSEPRRQQHAGRNRTVHGRPGKNRPSNPGGQRHPSATAGPGGLHDNPRGAFPRSHPQHRFSAARGANHAEGTCRRTGRSSQMERLLATFGPRYDLTFFLAHSLELEGNPEAALGLLEERPRSVSRSR